MPEGWRGPDDPTGPETFRRLPIDPVDEALRPAPETDSEVPDSFSTEIQGLRSGIGSGSGSGSGGSFVERGEVEVEVGRLVFGKYLVLELLGEGAMGEVWLVKDVELDVNRALKMITKGTDFDKEARARFRREARAMARFTHPNVVAVHDSRLDRRDVAYIVMEYVPGQTIEKILRPGQPMPLGWTLNVLSQLCEALQVAHDQGIVHRDLKPSNLILVPTPSRGELLKVFDFGIAKILRVEGGPAEIQTSVGDFVGTPPYASPEQVGGRAEASSDLYSVGVLLFEFLTGFRPFVGKPAIVNHCTLNEPPPSFAEVNPEAKVPPEVERVVLRCLAKNPQDRPHSALGLLEEFKAAMSEAPIAPTQPETIPVKMRPEATPRSLRRPFLIAVSVVATAIALGFAGPMLSWRRPIARSTVPTATSATISRIEPRIIRDGRTFRLWNGRVYLPEGYDAADFSDLDEAGYPKAIVRPDGVKFVRISGGQFRMGAQGEEDADDNNRPERLVVVPGFYIQKLEVTNSEILAYLKSHQDEFNDETSSESWRTWYDQLRTTLSPEAAARHPARQVPWRFAAEFARSVGGWLPSEAQWEYAARSGETARVRVWDPEKELELPRENLANLDREPRNGIRTTEVGVFPNDQTRQAVMDMAGNVREWCRDPWIAYDKISTHGPPRLPDNPSRDTLIVVRGGSFQLDFDYRFVTRRGKPIRLSEETPRDVGFRLVIECPEVRPDP
jgi:eukaryotic-like serine/threonine-protein kinase